MGKSKATNYPYSLALDDLGVGFGFMLATVYHVGFPQKT